MITTSFYCEICGRSTMKGGHRCPEFVLRAIDAANTRAENQEFETVASEPFHRTESRRIAEGFFLLSLTGD